MNYLILAVFIASYLLFFLFPKHRHKVAVVSVILLFLFGWFSGKFLPVRIVRAVNWNVMGIFVGTLVLADLFTYSRTPAVLAESLVNRASSAGLAILFICILSSAISAFVENVATVLIVAPVAFAVCERVKINPSLPIIGIAISSNLQGTATLIGDPPSMLLAGYAKMGFNDFFIYRGRPGIFFAVQIGAVFSFLALWLIFRKYKQNVQVVKVEKVKVWTPVFLLTAMVVLLAFSSLIDPGFGFAAGMICMILAAAGIAWYVFLEKGKSGPLLKNLDWQTAIFLMGIFILVGGLEAFGWIDRTAEGLGRLIGRNRLLAFFVIVSGSVMISAFVDNVPYLAAMIPVAQRLADGLGHATGAGASDRSLLLFGLLIGSCLGGNITPVGASANIVGVGLLKKRGYVVTFREFVGVGLPFTLAAIVPSAVFLWLIWS